MLESKPTPVSYLGLRMYLSTIRHSLGRLERVSPGPMSSAADSGSMLSPAHYYVDTLAHPAASLRLETPMRTASSPPTPVPPPSSPSRADAGTSSGTW